jgi:perosamine synthetase
MPTCDTASWIPSPHLAGEGDVREFERLLTRYYGMRYAVCVSNCTTGLLAIALALGLRRSNFITTPLTYGGSLSGWLLLENEPVFVDVEPRSVTLDPENVVAALRAILAVDLLGYPVDVARLRNIASDNGLFLVVDAAQSFGATRDGHPAGYGADAIVVSFTSGKSLDVGEGGAVITDDPELYEQLVWWTQHPLRQKRDLGLTLTNEFALNGRIHPLAATQAVAGWHVALSRCAERQKQVELDLKHLASMGLIEPVRQGPSYSPSYFRTLVVPHPGLRSSLHDVAADRGIRDRFEPLPVSFIPKNPSFLAQFRTTPRRCPQAIWMLRNTFCFTPSTCKAAALSAV